MASGPPSMDVEQEARCPICLEYLRDPVTLDCGHNFCQGCITSYCQTWEELCVYLECPVCRSRIQKGNFRPNWQLANIIEKIKLLPLNQEKERLYVRPKEKLSLFCVEDKELMCSPLHKSLTVLPKEEATEEFKDPTTIERGHNFCQACLTHWWKKSNNETSCPKCRAPLQQKNMMPNWKMANFGEIVKKRNMQEAKGKWTVCEKHTKPLTLFCMDDETLICWVCDKTKEHRDHVVVPLEEASQSYKSQICARLENLRKERENILAYKVDTQKESQDLLKLTKTENEKFLAHFRQLHQFLEEQKMVLLAQMEELEKEIARKRAEHLARLSGELSSLESIIWEMEEKSQQPARELLQDIRSTLHRCKREKFENPGTFPPELKWRIWDFCDTTLFLWGVMKQFKSMLQSGLQLQKGTFGGLVDGQIYRKEQNMPENGLLLFIHWNSPVLSGGLSGTINILTTCSANVTLDPDTAHPRLILSVDYKSVKWRYKLQDLPDKPERFDVLPFVLGREGFTAGRHFWEVTVGSERNWAVGFTRKSVRRKGTVPFNPGRGIWAVGKLTGYDFNSSHLSLTEKVKKIRVSLNYEGGRVSFFDADSAALLHLSLASSFAGETLLPFIYILGGAHLILSS